MKNYVVAVILLLSVSSVCNSQNSDKSKSNGKVTTFTGYLVGWADNEDYVYEGFYLKTWDTKFLVLFSPEMGKIIRRKFKADTLLSLDGVLELSKSGKKLIRLVSIKTDESTVFDTLNTLVEKETAGKFVSGSGKINEIEKDNKGKSIGFALSDQTVLHVPLSFMDQFAKMVLVGATISYSGEKQKLSKGEAALMNYRVINCYTITIEGKQYFTR